MLSLAGQHFVVFVLSVFQPTYLYGKMLGELAVSTKGFSSIPKI